MDYSTRATEAMQNVIATEMKEIKRRQGMVRGTTLGGYYASLQAAHVWDRILTEFALMGSVMITPEDVQELTGGLKEAAGTSVFTDLGKLRKALDEAPVPIRGRSIVMDIEGDLHELSRLSAEWGDKLPDFDPPGADSHVDELVGSQGAPRRERKGKRKDWERSASVKQAHSGKKQASIAKRQRLREDLAAKGIHYRER